MKTEILFEDGDILVVYKPGGIAVQTAKAGEQDVVSELKNYLRKNGRSHSGFPNGTNGVPYLGIIHRLDQPVEGLLVFGKNKKAAAVLSGQLQKSEEDTFHKHYYGVICGQPDETKGELVDYLYKSKENRAEIATGPHVPGAKKAVLWYRTLKKRNKTIQSTQGQEGEIKETLGNTEDETVGQSGEAQIALMDIHIQTGRFHQIRAQLAHGGMPLLGDVKYGGEEVKALSRQWKINYVALCAYRLVFTHPLSGEKMCFEAKPRGRAFSFFSQE